MSVPARFFCRRSCCVVCALVLALLFRLITTCVVKLSQKRFDSIATIDSRELGAGSENCLDAYVDQPSEQAILVSSKRPNLTHHIRALPLVWLDLSVAFSACYQAS